MHNKSKNKTTTFKTLLILSITSMMLISGGIIPVYAAPGDVLSTVEINDSTVDGPILVDDDRFYPVTNIDDLDGDGVNDIAVGAYRDDNGGIDRGAVHIIFLNADGSPKNIVEINSSTLNGPTLFDRDTFGNSVANIGDLDGDGVNDIAVSAIIDGTAAVGDRGEGAIYIIFLNSDGSPKNTVKIDKSTINGPILDNDSFGSSVTNIGDLDGDGVTDIVVGASGDDEGGTNRGTVHIIFLNSDGSPKSTSEINSSTPNGPNLADNDGFGGSVSNMGDLDGDGISDIVVGAAGDDAGGTNRGTVHIIFLNSDGTPKTTVEVNDSTVNGPILSDDDIFGQSVASIGDLNGDGVNDIAVGSVDAASDAYRGTVHIIFLDGILPSPAPISISLVADDPDDLDDVYSVDDTITITFDSDTNMPGGISPQTKTAVDDLFTFTESLGDRYRGQWSMPDTFTITILDVNNAGPPIINTTTVTPAGTTPILSADETSESSIATSPILTGDFGEVIILECEVEKVQRIYWDMPLDAESYTLDLPQLDGYTIAEVDFDSVTGTGPVYVFIFYTPNCE